MSEAVVNIYLVGGAVRDALLGIEVKDRDYVVVGATPSLLINKGFSQVGKDFPVFLHPKTHEEHALARTERKQGQGYTGFICDFSVDVTLEQDLARRDLTINAIAQNAQGELIDPYHGQRDLALKQLRHVSPAFVEDPLRVLRVARFAARFHHLGFCVADETLQLMRQIAQSGELETLTAERVWSELERALSTENPQVFFRVLRECGALAVLFPELNALFGVPARADYHPEICTGIHTLMVLEQAAKHHFVTPVRFAALCHDFGKALTAKDVLPSHPNHGMLGVPLIEAFCQRLRVPNEYRDLALLVAKHHINIHNSENLKSSTLLNLLDALDAWRKPQRVEQVLAACLADMRGRLGWEQSDYPGGKFLRLQFAQALKVDVQSVIKDGFKGAAISAELRARRIATLKAHKIEYLSQQ